MTERTAILLVYTAMCVALALAFFVVRALHISDHAIVLAYIAVLAVGADTCARVVMHYADKSPSKRDRR